MSVIAWPELLKPRSSTWRFARTQQMGPETMGGVRQVLIAPGGRWYASVSLDLHTPVRVRAYRALLAQLRGMANAIAVPVFDPYGGGLDAATTHPTQPQAAGDTSIIVPTGVFRAQALQAGNYVGIGGYLHIITGTALAGGTIILSLEPELRVAVTTGAVVTSSPTSTMRLIDPTAGAAELDLQRFGNVELRFVEAYEAMA